MVIQDAIKIVFLNSHHRLCLWHIMKKIPDKLQGLNKYKAIKTTLKSIIYEIVDIKKFEDIWLKMIKDYDFEKNERLNFYIKIVNIGLLYMLEIFSWLECLPLAEVKV